MTESLTFIKLQSSNKLLLKWLFQMTNKGTNRRKEKILFVTRITTKIVEVKISGGTSRTDQLRAVGLYSITLCKEVDDFAGANICMDGHPVFYLSGKAKGRYPHSTREKCVPSYRTIMKISLFQFPVNDLLLPDCWFKWQSQSSQQRGK